MRQLRTLGVLLAWSLAAVACRSGSGGDAGDAGSVPCVEMCLEEQQQDQQINCQAELAACMMQ